MYSTEEMIDILREYADWADQHQSFAPEDMADVLRQTAIFIEELEC